MDVNVPSWAKFLEVSNGTIVGGYVNSEGYLILENNATDEINAGLVIRPAQVDVFTTTGLSDWSKPDGAKIVQVIAIGGGGGGAGGYAPSSLLGWFGGGGGGGGGYNERTFRADLLGSTEQVYVGGGGAGAAGQNSGTGPTPNKGGNGENTMFGSGANVLLQANGGMGGGYRRATISESYTPASLAAAFRYMLDEYETDGDGLNPVRRPGQGGNGSSPGGASGTDIAPATIGAASFTSLQPRPGSGGGGAGGWLFVDYDDTDADYMIVRSGAMGTPGGGGGGAGAVATEAVARIGGNGGAGSAGAVPGGLAVALNNGNPGGDGSSHHLGGGGGAGGSTYTVSGYVRNGGNGGLYGGGGGGGSAMNIGSGTTRAAGNGGNGAQGLCIVVTYF